MELVTAKRIHNSIYFSVIFNPYIFTVFIRLGVLGAY